MLIYAGVGVVLAFSLIPVFFIEEPRELQGLRRQPDGTAAVRRTLGAALRTLSSPTPSRGLACRRCSSTSSPSSSRRCRCRSMPALAAEETGRIIAISFAVLNTVGFLLPAPVLEPLAMQVRTRARAYPRPWRSWPPAISGSSPGRYTLHALSPDGRRRDRLGLDRVAAVRDHVRESGNRPHGVLHGAVQSVGGDPPAARQPGAGLRDPGTRRTRRSSS